VVLRAVKAGVPGKVRRLRRSGAKPGVSDALDRTDNTILVIYFLCLLGFAFNFIYQFRLLFPLKSSSVSRA